ILTDHAVLSSTFYHDCSDPFSEEYKHPQSRVKKYGASFGEFADNLSEQKIAQLEEVKQASTKQIQDDIELEEEQQALVQKHHHLFDVRGITSLWPGKLLTGNNCIQYTERTGAYDKLGEEAHGAEHLCTAGKGNNCQVQHRSKAAHKEALSTASS
ncbi:ATP synthase F(0) complex subunit B1, mitochondrial, partial [Galemys pyrenaicus]